MDVKYEISPLPQYKIFSLLFVLGYIVFVLGPMNQIDAHRFATLQLAMAGVLGLLTVTACFFIANMVLFPYRFDKFMQSCVREFVTVFHQVGASSQLPDEKTAN